MASPGQKRGTGGHIMALFDSHSKCACCREKGIGKDPCVEKKPCDICESFSEDQKKPPLTGQVRSSRKRQALPTQIVDPADLTVLGQVRSNGDNSDRGKTPSKKPKNSQVPF